MFLPFRNLSNRGAVFAVGACVVLSGALRSFASEMRILWEAHGKARLLVASAICQRAESFRTDGRFVVLLR